MFAMAQSMSHSPAEVAAQAVKALQASARTALEAAEVALASSATAAVSDATVQALLTAGLRLYARKSEEERRHFLALTSRNSATPTDVAVTVLELLRAVNLNLFDLSMWAGRPREDGDDNAV